jgi:hypothetical protein
MHIFDRRELNLCLGEPSSFHEIRPYFNTNIGQDRVGSLKEVPHLGSRDTIHWIRAVSREPHCGR